MSHIKPTNAQFVDLEGRKFGRLAVVEFAGPIPSGRPGYQWSCRCECGATLIVRGSNLGDGHTRSCGCLNADATALRNLSHGESRTPMYARWCTLRARCENPANKSYPDYGGRGIHVCQRYASSYEAFHADMGDPPTKGSTIDRSDNEGHYSCGQCDECSANGWAFNLHWASRTHQARNRRSTAFLTFDGKTLPVKEWAELSGVPYYTLRYRLSAGWSVEDALGREVRSH